MNSRTRARVAPIALIAALALIIGASSFAFAGVSTDQADYSPGSTVTISGNNTNGAGYVPGETVHVDVAGPVDGYALSCEATVGDDGSWSCPVTLRDDDSSIGSYTYTASGAQAFETGTFTDGPPPPGGSLCNTPAAASGSATADLLPTLNDTHYKVQVGATVTGALIIGASDEQARTDLAPCNDSDQVNVIVKSSMLGNTTVCGTKVGGDVVFSYTAPLNGCETTNLSYNVEGTKADNDIIKDGVDDNDSGSGAGYAFVDANGNVIHGVDTDGVDGVDACSSTTIPTADAPTIDKTASGTYKDTYVWTPEKSVDDDTITTATSATFNYTVKAGHDAGTISDVKVAGTITVSNPNADPINISGVTDTLPGGTCSVTGTFPAPIPATGTAPFSYECTLSALPAAPITNSATVTWLAQELPTSGHLDAGSADVPVPVAVAFTPSTIDECTSVTDSFKGTLGTVCVGDANPTSFTYSRTINATPNRCVNYDNTATSTTNDSGTKSTDNATVTVCGPVTGGLTIGYWQNKNGQDTIKNGPSTNGVCNSGTALRAYNPFKDLSATATCAQVATYVTNIIKAANASGTSMNPMLKAQMMATALDVNFGKVSGGVNVDLTMIPKPIGSSTYENTSGAFGGGVCQTVNALLTAAAGQSNSGGSAWYGQVKATQELAKDTFDAINNAAAFTC